MGYHWETTSHTQSRLSKHTFQSLERHDPPIPEVSDILNVCLDMQAGKCRHIEGE